MQSKEENQFIAIKLDDGEDLLGSLVKITEKHKVRSALILSGIGMLRDFEIGYYNGEKYINENFADPMELLSMHGSIAEGSENKIHIHVSLASGEHKVFGGHLVKATVCILNELVLYKLEDTVLSRKFNEKTNLMELAIS